jgi:hypothetical protein
MRTRGYGRLLAVLLVGLLVTVACSNPVAVEHTTSSGNHTTSSGNHTTSSGNLRQGRL